MLPLSLKSMLHFSCTPHYSMPQLRILVIMRLLRRQGLSLLHESLGMGCSLRSDPVLESYAENLLSRVTSTTKSFRLSFPQKQSLRQALANRWFIFRRDSNEQESETRKGKTDKAGKPIQGQLIQKVTALGMWVLILLEIFFSTVECAS